MAVDRPGWIWPERRHFQFCLAASAFLFLVCAVFSAGTHDPDEYFQIIEFASTKLSISDTADLTWEYREQMRPWLQPAMYVGVARAAGHFGIHRPLTLLFLFRLLTAVIAWSSLWTLVAAGRRWFVGEADRRHLYSVAAFLWLLPFLGVRTSGETLATSALCFGIALLEWRTSLSHRGGRFGFAVLAGVAFGLCFDFRYASGVMAAGAGLWYLRPAQERLALFAGLVLGALLALVPGVLADWWGYGSLTFPVYSYLYQNFVLGRASKDFGSAPFFAYLYLPLQEAGAMAPLVLALILATLVAWWARARSVLTWATAPYVVLLCIAAHKEARFLFPLAPFLPFFVVIAFASEPPVARTACFFSSVARERLPLEVGISVECRWSSGRHFAAAGSELPTLQADRRRKLRRAWSARGGGYSRSRQYAVFVCWPSHGISRAQEFALDLRSPKNRPGGQIFPGRNVPGARRYSAAGARARRLDTQSMCFCVVYLAAVGAAVQLLPVAEPVSWVGTLPLRRRRRAWSVQHRSCASRVTGRDNRSRAC